MIVDSPHNFQATPEQIRAFLAEHNLTQAEAARLAGVSPRQMRAYLAGETAKGRTPMPYPVAFTLVNRAGV